MSDTQDSPNQSMENGDASNENHVSEADKSNGVINQEEVVNVVRHVESKEEMFEDAPEDIQETPEMDNGAGAFDPFVELRSLQDVLDKTFSEKESIEKEFKEEREGIKMEVANLLTQLKGLTDEKLRSSESLGEEGVKKDIALGELISECSLFVGRAMEERLQNERQMLELRKQIEELNAGSHLDQSIEIVADRMLGSLSMVVSQEELLDQSIGGKIGLAETSASLLVEQYRWVLYEVDQLKQCLSDGGLNIGTQEEFWPASVLAAARTQLLEVKTKDADFEGRVQQLEGENRKLLEEIDKERAMVGTANAEFGRVKAELEQEKNRLANTKEKLSMAVTKGKALVQQRDTLKQFLAEKSCELDKCLEELREKSSVCQAAELQKEQLSKLESLVASLEQTLSQKNSTIESIEDIFSEISLTEDLETNDIVGKSKGLVNLVTSLQEMISQKNSAFENFEEIFSQVTFPKELKSVDVTEKLRWLVGSVLVMQETNLQRNLILEDLDKIFCQIPIPEELQSSELNERLVWLVEERNVLKGSLVEFEKLKDALLLFDLPEAVSSLDLETKVSWLKESFEQSRRELNTLQDEMAKIKEAAQNEIDRLSASFSTELQENAYIKLELDDFAHKLNSMVERENKVSFEKDQIVRKLLESSGVVVDNVEQFDAAMLIDRCFEKIKEERSESVGTSVVGHEIIEKFQGLLYVRYQELSLCEELLEEDTLVRLELNNLANELRTKSLQLIALKEGKGSLQKDLERAEEKSALVREKLSLAVKKGKGLVQDRENLKLLVDEKNSEIEKLKRELEKQESNVTMCKDQINQLSIGVDVKNIEFEKLKLELHQQEYNVAACKDQINQLSTDLDGKNSEIENLKLELQRQESNVAICKEHITQLSTDINNKNSEVEHFKLELQQQNSHAAILKDQINQLSADTEQIPRLETDLIAMRDQQNQLEQFLSQKNDMLERILSSIDRINLPLDMTFEEPVGKVDFLEGYVKECVEDKIRAEHELERCKDESRILASHLAELQLALKTLEDDLMEAKNHISRLTEEKREIEDAKRSIEQDLQKAQDEAVMHTTKFTEACASTKPLEDALHVAEGKISQLVKEQEETRLSKAATESELEKLREEVAIQMSKLADAYENRRSLEDALSRAEANLLLLMERNNSIQVGRTNLENDLKELKHEADCQAAKLADASVTINSLEDVLSKATSDISVLEDEKRIAKQEISSLSSKLTACMDELAGTNDNLQSGSVELIHQLGDLQMVIKDKTLLSAIRNTFMKNFENLKLVNIVLKDISAQAVNIGSQLLQAHPNMEADSHVTTPFPLDFLNTSSFDLDNGEVRVDASNILLYVKKTAEILESRDRILADCVESFSKFLDYFTEALLRKLGATRDEVTTIVEHMDSMKVKMNNLVMNEKEKDENILKLENDCGILLSACVNAIKELKFEVKNNLLDLSSIPEFEKLMLSFVQDGSNGLEHLQVLDESNCAEMASKLLVATRVVKCLVEQFESACTVAATSIEELQNNLSKSRADGESATEEKGMLEKKVSELENELEVLQTSHEELSHKLQQYHAIEEKLKEKEVEVANLNDNLLMQQKEAENALMSTSQLRSLFDKIKDIEIFSPKSVVEDFTSDEVKRLFYVIDTVTDLQQELKVLSHDKDELELKLSAQNIEIEHLKDEMEMQIGNTQEVEETKREISELTSGLEKIINDLGGKKVIQDQKPSKVLKLLPVLEKHVKDMEMQIGNKQEIEETKREISELTSGLENIIDALGGKKVIQDQKPSEVLKLLPVLEKHAKDLRSEAENSKSHAQELGNKLLESQTVIDEFAKKIKLLEDSLQSRDAKPELVKERSIFEAPPLPTSSEITEIEDAGAVAKNAVPFTANALSTAPTAAHVRTMKKGSTDHLALNVDLESVSLVNGEEVDEDKGHMFKSLNTSGLIPKQGKSIADRVDGIWVSGGRMLMSRPRARLGVIVYYIILHLWLLGTIL